MASDFVGYTVLVTLSSPPNAQVQGVVADVVEQRLILQDVALLWNGQSLPSYQIDSSLIVDLEVSPRQRHSVNAAPGVAHVSAQNEERPEPRSDGSNLHNVENPAQQVFHDPAILSFSKPRADHGKGADARRPSVQHQRASPVMIADSFEHGVPTPVVEGPRRTPVGLSRTSTLVPAPDAKPLRTRDRRDSSATATLTEPFDNMALNGASGLPNPIGSPLHGPDVQAPPSGPAAGRAGTKKPKRNGQRKTKETSSPAFPRSINPRDGQATANGGSKPKSRGKGWRQTPIIEEPAARTMLEEPHPKRKVRKLRAEETNGWATEEATDIQDLGDFDFATNLSKFDKRRVFDDIRKVDNTADNDRLVSFNRRARPGTEGGKNLHYTENVLDSPKEDLAGIWKSEGGDTEDDLREVHYSSGRGSRQATSIRPLPSRKGSAVPPSLSRGMSRMESPRPIGRFSATASPVNGGPHSSRRSFRLSPTNKPCPCVSPLQMLEVEQVCLTELGISEDILTENAGRGMAEAALKMPDGLSATPDMLFLIGNHKSGARAVAGARHLRNRGVKVLLCILGGERDDLIDIVGRQLDIYKKSGGLVVRWSDLQAKFSVSPYVPPELIVDALLGMHITFDDLRADEQIITDEMIYWANKSNLPILSVEVPSGFDAASGEVTMAPGGPVGFRSSYIVCLGAPKTGLLNPALHAAMRPDRGREKVELAVVDIGISKAAWRKHGSRRRHGVDFGKEWFAAIKFVEGMS